MFKKLDYDTSSTNCTRKQPPPMKTVATKSHRKSKRISSRIKGNGAKTITVNKMTRAAQDKLHKVSKALAATLVTD